MDQEMRRLKAYYLEFLNTVADGDEFTSSPQESFHFDCSYASLERGHVGLIIPGLDIEDDVGLGDDFALLILLGSLSLVVGGDSFGLNAAQKL